MDIVAWVGSGAFAGAFATGLVVTAAWMSRKWWGEWIAQRVRGDVEAELEGLRSQMRTRENEISALRETGLSNVRTSQAALTQRRLQAVDDLWQGVEDWGKLSGTLMVMSIIKFEDVPKHLTADPKAMSQMQAMLRGANVEFTGLGAKAHSARPYISDLAWALFSAYQVLFGWAAFQAKVFVLGGMPLESYLKDEGVAEMLTKAMPDMADYIKTNWMAAQIHLPEVLRQRILTELRGALDGKEQDAASVERAAAIQKAVIESQAELTKQQKEAAAAKA